MIKLHEEHNNLLVVGPEMDGKWEKYALFL
jgi:hypothetical protein